MTGVVDGRQPDGTRTGFGSLRPRGVRWDSLPMRLFAGGNARFWNPADLDFSVDARDWRALDEVEQAHAAGLCAQFIAGEEAVTEDIQPFIGAMAAEGRLEDELYLTQFAFEEAKHLEGFRRWMDAVGLDEDFNDRIGDNPGYRQIFFDELPRSLQALRDDPSPAAQVRASVTYNHVVEGTLALTGYHTWDLICRERGILPGMQDLIKHISDDERRHMAWGTFTCRRHVAGDDANWEIVQARMVELLEPTMQLINFRHPEFAHLEHLPFGIDQQELTAYAMNRGTRRLRTIESARGRSVAEIEGDTAPLELEERFAVEDEQQRREAAGR